MRPPRDGGTSCTLGGRYSARRRRVLGFRIPERLQDVEGAKVRKADYSALAAIIRAEINGAKALHKTEPLQFEVHARYNTAKRIALEFAPRASVNRAEFLKACGITP